PRGARRRRPGRGRLRAAAAHRVRLAMYELDIVTEESLAQFVPRWYGLPDRPRSDRARPDGLPEPLITSYGIAEPYSLPLSRDYGFRPAGAREADGDITIFWKGGHDAYGFQLGIENPAVHERSGDQTWLPTGESLRRFLVYVAVYEAVYAPIHGLVGL